MLSSTHSAASFGVAGGGVEGSDLPQAHSSRVLAVIKVIILVFNDIIFSFSFDCYVDNDSIVVWRMQDNCLGTNRHSDSKKRHYSQSGL